MASAYLKYVRPYQKEQGALLPNQASRRMRCEPAAQFPTAELTATCEADRYLARFGPTHRRAFRVASGPIVARSAFMLQHLFVSERPSPSARERVHLEDFGSTDLMKSHDSRHVSLLLRVIRRQPILRDSSGRGKPGNAPYTLGSWA